MPRDPNLNALWCRAIAEELVRAGAAHAILCPGSRNAPLLFALAEAFGPMTERGHRGRCAWAHVDERSAAFMALGAAKATGRPAVVCATSGTAVANCAPALAEARAARLPLIVVAADRPWELHDRGAPQTMPQAGALRAFVDAELDLGEPTGDDLALRALRGRVSGIAQRRGPALIDVPLREPLTPVADPRWSDGHLSPEALDGRGRDRPFTAVGATSGQAPSDPRWLGAPQARLLDWLKPGLRGLVVSGANGARRGEDFARIAGFPRIADAMARGDGAIALADALVGGPLGREAPDLIVIDGSAPLARATYEHVGRQRCPVLVLDDGADQDFLANAWARVPSADRPVVEELARRCATGDAAWLARWRDADRRARARLAELMAVEPWGEPLIAHLALNHRGFRRRHVASSMPARHANLHALAGAEANRGLNGIDGTIATAIGAGLASLTNGVLLIGDLAFLHDLPALAALAQKPYHHGMDLAIVVINNDGGGIFDFLPVAQAPGYREWVRTPHGLGFEHAARQFGLRYARATTREALDAALDAAAPSGGGATVVECVVRPGEAVERHRALLKALADP